MKLDITDYKTIMACLDYCYERAVDRADDADARAISEALSAIEAIGTY